MQPRSLKLDEISFGIKDAIMNEIRNAMSTTIGYSPYEWEIKFNEPGFTEDSSNPYHACIYLENVEFIYTGDNPRAIEILNKHLNPE